MKWSIHAAAGKLFVLRFFAIYPVNIGDECLCQMAGSAVALLPPIVPGVRKLAKCDAWRTRAYGMETVDGTDDTVPSMRCLSHRRCVLSQGPSGRRDQLRTGAVQHTTEYQPSNFRTDTGVTENTWPSVTASHERQRFCHGRSPLVLRVNSTETHDLRCYSSSRLLATST